MRHGLASSFGVLVSLLAFSPMGFAQTSQPSETKKAPATSSSSAMGLSHDLSGVWMQYDDGTAPGFARMNAVDDRARPPLTPWGQAKFDAAKPLSVNAFTPVTPLPLPVKCPVNWLATLFKSTWFAYVPESPPPLRFPAVMA